MSENEIQFALLIFLSVASFILRLLSIFPCVIMSNSFIKLSLPLNCTTVFHVRDLSELLDTEGIVFFLNNIVKTQHISTEFIKTNELQKQRRKCGIKKNISLVQTRPYHACMCRKMIVLWLFFVSLLVRCETQK